MKINIQNVFRTIIPMLTFCIKRVFPLISCFVLIVCCLCNSVMPVRAADESVIDLSDYLSSFTADDGVAYVTYDLQADAYFGYWSYYSDERGTITDGRFFCPVTDFYYLYYYPVGSHYIDVSDLVDGSVISLKYNIPVRLTEVQVQYPDVYISWKLFCYDKNSNFISELKTTETVELEDVDVYDVVNYGLNNINFEFPAGTVYIWPSVEIAQYFTGGSGIAFLDSSMSLYADYDLVIKDSQTSIKIENLLEDQGKTLEDVLSSQEETNYKLDGIQDSIDDTNEKLDEVITGDKESLNQADQIISDGEQVKQDAEDLISDGQEAMDQLDQLDRPEVDGLLDSPDWAYDGDVAFDLNKIVQILWNNDLISQMMILAGTVMLGSYILFGKKV